MVINIDSWCEVDHHDLYKYYSDFNDWLESDEGGLFREENYVEALSQPSKALFASDKNAYDQAFIKYRNEKRHKVLNDSYFQDQFNGNHWPERNLDRFMQLVGYLEEKGVVPFIGAGTSVAGGFPTWEDHLKEQARTANMNEQEINNLLDAGKYEIVIDKIESTRGRDTFIQELRDVFSRTGKLADIHLALTELFTDTLITTNYDHLLEQAFDTGAENKTQIIIGNDVMIAPIANKTTIYKLHGDIRTPAECIISKGQYDRAYGGDDLDLTLPIPRLLAYHYKNSNLLFLGSSLNKDRTIKVFEAVKLGMNDTLLPQHFSLEQAPEQVSELSDRNSELLSLGITPIWYQKGQYGFLVDLLRHAMAEINHRKAATLLRNGIDTLGASLEQELVLSNPGIWKRIKQWWN